MRKTIAATLAAFAALILLLCLLFSVAVSTAENYPYLERRFMELGVSDATGVGVSDLSKAMQTLTGYVNGKNAAIETDVMLHGEKTQMFPLSAEKTHMQEVRALYHSLLSARGTGLFTAFLLLAFSLLLYPREALGTACRGCLAAFVAFMTMFAFAGIWAGTNFASFSRFLHGILFPNSDAWMLPAESRLGAMFTDAMLRSLLLRCGILSMLPAVIAGVLAVMGMNLHERKTEARTGIAEKEAEPEEDIPPESSVGEPDLVFMHKKTNMSVTRRRRLLEVMHEKDEQERNAAELKEAAGPKETASPDDDKLKVTFAPYVPSPEPEKDEDGDDEDEDEEE